MNKIDNLMFSTSASSFFDELFSEHDNTIINLPDNKSKLRMAKESPRVYRFNPQALKRSRAPTVSEVQPEARGRSSTPF